MMRAQSCVRRIPLASKSLQKRCYVLTAKHRAPEDGAGSGRTQGPNLQNSGTEPLGRGFYVSIAAIAGFLAVYKFSRSSSLEPADAGSIETQPLVTRFIHRLYAMQEEFRTRNIVQVDYLDAAGRDRRLFQGVQRSGDVDLSFPEAFNSSSVRNVPAGSQANLDDLYDFYNRQQTQMVTEREERARRLERIRASHGIGSAEEGEKRN